MAKRHPVCTRCGSRDVLADAFAEWNDEKQRWGLQNTFDKGSWCQECDDVTTLRWEED
jgi:hypothetical protein